MQSSPLVESEPSSLSGTPQPPMNINGGTNGAGAPISFESVHSLSHATSVLEVAASSRYLFTGTLSSLASEAVVTVWRLGTFEKVAEMRGHTRSISRMCLSQDGLLLFTSSKDGTVRIWSTEELRCIAVLETPSNMGDLFSVTHFGGRNILALACQNTSILLVQLSEGIVIDAGGVSVPLDERSVKFFGSIDNTRLPSGDCVRTVLKSNSVFPHCHSGYVFCLISSFLPEDPSTEVLISGSGDGTVKIWKIEDPSPNTFDLTLIKTLKVSHDAVLALQVLEGLLYCGLQGSDIKVWDLETFQQIRVLKGHTDDVLTLTPYEGFIISGSADGTIKVWNKNLLCCYTLENSVAKGSKVLSIATGKNFVYTGSSDANARVWRVLAQREDLPVQENQEFLLKTLQEFVRFKSVSADTSYSQESRRCAKYLRDVFALHGALTKLASGQEGRNPLLLAKFVGQENKKKKKPVILFYGHYDVHPVGNEQWKTPPFEMTGIDGYVYGRGVSDNKGPIIAALFAVSELFQAKQLFADVCFLIEGEEEVRSEGIETALVANANFFPKPDVVLISNTTWLGEIRPCLTYGLRGKVSVQLEVSGTKDLHSGVDGGVLPEPLADLIRLLSQLIGPDEKCLIPGFYQKVRHISPAEEALYEEVSKVIPSLELGPNSTNYKPKTPREAALARWHHPTISFHGIQVSGLGTATIIPGRATATVSMRIVPDQNPKEVVDSLKEYINKVFQWKGTCNSLKVECLEQADWWLGDLNNKFFKAAEVAIEKAWGQKPQCIREGGTIPVTQWLEKRFDAPAIHLPLGQSSDAAHLPNERIRVENLVKGREVFSNFIKEISEE